MKVRLHRVELPLEHAFTISRGTMNSMRSLIVEIEHEGQSGFGEATEHPYYEINLDSLTGAIENVREIIEATTCCSANELWESLSPLVSNTFALAAVDAAAHDLFGKLNRKHTYEMLDLSWEKIPDSSFTIGIDTPARMVDKLNERRNWSVFKIKLGTSHDIEIVSRLREHSDAVFRVDANCGWTVDETLDNAETLKELGVELIEQPLPADATSDDLLRVFQHSVLPIIADESCLIESDVERCAGFFHGINVKLSKCGGITPAARMLRRARVLGMQTMIGCMVESSVGISAAAQLLPLLDFADLDGAELLAGDAADGVRITNGSVALSQTFGNGVERLVPQSEDSP